MIKISARAHSNIDINARKITSPIRFAVIFLAAGFLLSACESNKLPEIGSLWPLSDAKSSKTVKTAASDKSEIPAVENTDGTEVAPKTDEDNIVLGGPGNTVVASAPKADGYPDLANQPDQPTDLLSTGESKNEINELKQTGANHVEERAVELDGDNFKAKDIKREKIAVKKDDSSIFDLDWLKSDNPKTSTDGLTPPQRLRLARAQALTPDAVGINDNVSTGGSDAPFPTLDLSANSDVASGPARNGKAAALAAKKPTAVKVASTSAGERPTSKQPKRIFFSSGAKVLNAKQQGPLDALAKLRDGANANVFVLGFAGVDSNASNDKNIESQNLAIARANYVAVGLRKRGFRGDQLVVQVVDEAVQAGAAQRRVEVYFQGRTPLRNSVIPN